MRAKVFRLAVIGTIGMNDTIARHWKRPNTFLFLAERTVQRAREKLGITVTMSGFGKEKKSIWSLPKAGNSVIRAIYANECQPENLGTHGMNGQFSQPSEII